MEIRAFSFTTDCSIPSVDVILFAKDFAPIRETAILQLRVNFAECRTLGTYIDYPFRAVLQIDTDAEVDEVIDGVTHLAEFVYRLLPIEIILVPLLAFQYGPTTEFS